MRTRSPRSIRQSGSIDMMHQQEMPEIMYYEYSENTRINTLPFACLHIAVVFRWDRRSYGPEIICVNNSGIMKKNFSIDGKRVGIIEWEEYRAARDGALIKSAAKLE
jgi:hypothetical protein